MTGTEIRINRQARGIELRQLARMLGWRSETLRDAEQDAVELAPSEIDKIKRTFSEFDNRASTAA